MDQDIKKMDIGTACMIAEGVQQASEEDHQRAWQYLFDQKAYLWLQGWYGRTMSDMLEAGYIVNHNVEVS